MSHVDPVLLDRIRVRLTEGNDDPTPANVALALRSVSGLVGDAAVLDVVEALHLDMDGAGPLEPLLRQAGVTDVLVNGPGAVYVDRGQGIERTDVRFDDDSSVRRLAQR